MGKVGKRVTVQKQLKYVLSILHILVDKTSFDSLPLLEPLGRIWETIGSTVQRASVGACTFSKYAAGREAGI